MERKNTGKLTLEEHKELGKFLRIAQDKLSGEAVKIKPKTKMRKSHENKALKLITKLKDHMEEIMFKDFRDISTSDGVNVYYGTAGRE
jgi:hypothetical protein